jgi:DNA-binding PadR family transcriptional regulator
MLTLSDKETALMVLLSEGPMHAYQIEREIENRSMRYWTEISKSSIYKLLRKLESAGLVVATQEPSENGMTRNVFRLAATGGAALKSRMAEILREPEHTKWRVDLATSHLDLLPFDEVRNHLTQYRAALVEGIEGYGRLEAYLKEQECPLHGLALARRPVALMKAECEWLDSYLVDLEEQHNG